MAFRAFQSAAFNQGFELQLYVEAAFMVESQIVSAMVDMLASADSARVAVAAQMTLIARDSQVRR